MGWPPRVALFFGIVGERILLGEDTGGYGGVFTYVHHLLAGQIGYTEARRTVVAFTYSREAMDECLDGLHCLVSTGVGV